MLLWNNIFDVCEVALFGTLHCASSGIKLHIYTGRFLEKYTVLFAV